MKTPIKLFFATLLCAMVLSSLTACTVNDKFGFTKSADNESYILVSYNGNEESVVIPSTYKGLPVTAIYDYAFYGCTSLTSVTIPDSVISIGDYAFDGCTSLVFNEYEDARYLGNDENPYHALIAPKDTKITSCKINEGTRILAGGAFRDCEGLTSITIPAGVTSISGSTFYGCKSLTSVTIPAGVTSIGYSAFYGCKSLTSVTIPDSVISIGNHAFDGCTSLVFNEYEGARYLGNDENPYHALIKAKDTKITSCKINEGTRILAGGAFRDCTSLTSVTIPERVIFIGDYEFYGCTSLTSVTIPAGVTSISDSTFDGCTNLTSVTIPERVISIGDYAFRDCKSLTSITIPNSVTSIGYSAFYGCKSLTSVTIPDSVTLIGFSAFVNSSLTSAVFEDPNGWHMGGRSFPASTLSDPSKAAECLTKKYSSQEIDGPTPWTKD